MWKKEKFRLSRLFERASVRGGIWGECFRDAVVMFEGFAELHLEFRLIIYMQKEIYSVERKRERESRLTFFIDITCHIEGSEQKGTNLC